MNLTIIIGNESYMRYDKLLAEHKENLYVIDNEDIYVARQKILNCKQTQIVISFDDISTYNKRYITEITDNINDNKTLYITSSHTDKMLTRIAKKHNAIVQYEGTDKNQFHVFKLLKDPANSTNLQKFMCVDLRLFLYWATNTHVSNAAIREITDKVSTDMEKSAITDKFLRSYIYYSFPRGLRAKFNAKWRKKQKAEIKSDVINEIMKEYRCTKNNAIKLYNDYNDIKQYNPSFHIKSFEGLCVENNKKIKNEKNNEKKIAVKEKVIIEDKVLGTLDRW